MSFFVLVGLVIVVAGATLIVQGVQGQRGALRSLGGAAVIVGVLTVLLSTAFVIIPAGHVGVVFSVFGGVKDAELREGLHFVMPVVQQVTLYDVRQKELTLGQQTNDVISARSDEGLEITVDVTILYQVAGDRAARLHQNIGPSYESVRVRPEVRSQIRDGIAGYRAADLISTRRSDLQRQIEQALITRLEADDILVRSVLLRDVRIPEAITRAIEEKQAAEQQVQVEENRRRQSEIAAQRAVIEAQGQSDAAVARATADAKALELKGAAIRANPEIVQLEVAQRLAPTVQTIMLPAEGNFLLDLRSLMTPAPSVQTGAP